MIGDPNIPLANVRTQLAVLSHSTARTSFSMALLSIAAGMALLLGIVGLYGVIAFTVSTRTQEIEIHMAMRARLHTVTAMVPGAGVGGGRMRLWPSSSPSLGSWPRTYQLGEPLRWIR